MLQGQYKHNIFLRTITCKFCKQKITGDHDFHVFHYYQDHKEKIKGMVISAQPHKTPSQVKEDEGKSIDDMVEEIFVKMRNYEEREKKYC